MTDQLNDKFNKIKEGKANVYFNKVKNQVFYNPIQEFNRDLSIAVLNTYSVTNNSKKLKILEALAASGIRSMRYALEIENCEKIVANDLDKKAVELIDINIELNKVGNVVKSNHGDCLVYMNTTSQDKSQLFDCIDLDPYGSPSIFFDASIRSIKSGGLLLVTATDAGVLCGNGSDTCYTKYGALSARTPCCHEMALRILLQSINNHAIRYSKYIVPVLSLSIDFYFRCFVLVFDSQLKAKESVSNIGNAYFCNDCHSFYQQNYGTSVETKGNVKFVPTHTHDFNINKCSNCEGCLKLAGPLWLGKIHDEAFVKLVIDHIEADTKNNYATKSRMLGMLNLVAEELPNPFYYVLDDISSVMHCETPNHSVFRSAILNAKYKVSYSHCNKNSIKTDAPTNFIFSVLKKWTEQKPIKEKWLNTQYRVFHILKNLTESNVDLTLNENWLPSSKKEKLLRFHEPPPFWGPKAKPKRKLSVDADESEKKPINKNEKQRIEVETVKIKK